MQQQLLLPLLLPRFMNLGIEGLAKRLYAVNAYTYPMQPRKQVHPAPPARSLGPLQWASHSALAGK